MTRHIPDDRRFMGHEQRVAEGFMAPREVERTAPAVETCFCGKTVVKTHGREVRIDGAAVTCPRECEAERV